MESRRVSNDNRVPPPSVRRSRLSASITNRGLPEPPTVGIPRPRAPVPDSPCARRNSSRHSTVSRGLSRPE